MEKETKTTDAQKKAIYKYDEKFERINVNNFIKLAVAEKLEREEKILKKAQNTIDI